MSEEKKSLWNIWTKTIAVLSAIGMLISTYIFFTDRLDTKYARAEDLQETEVLLADSLKQINQSINKTNVRIDLRALEDEARYIKREMSEMRVKCKTANAYEMPEDVRKRYLDYQIRLDQIHSEMKALRGKY